MSFISRRTVFNILLVVISLFSSTLYAQNATVPVSASADSINIVGASRVKSSAIPDKREYPINKAINPCVNFYEYACSNVIDSFKLREDRSRHAFAFSDASERLLEFKKKYFSKLAQKKPGSKMEEEVKNSYVACMNKPAREKEEKEFVAKTKEKLKNIKTRQEFVDMVAANITSASALNFVGFVASLSNQDRPNYNDLCFDTHLMSLPEKSYYENRELTKELRGMIELFFITIGEEAPKRKADLVFNFEKELAQHYPTPHQQQERVFSKTQISREELIANYPYLKLEAFLSSIPKHTFIRNIVGNDTMSFLNEKLKTASLEELKSVVLYFQLGPIMDDAYPEFFAKQFELNKKYLGGPDKRSDRQERCSRSVMGSFEKEVDFILLPKFFPNFPKGKFIKMIEKIRSSLIDQLNSNEWLGADTKKEAMRKIKTAKLMLVSPNNDEEWNFNPRANYSTDTHIANWYKLHQLLMDKSLKELDGPIDINRWQMGPLTVSAYYEPSYNQFVLPVGILQYPFYDPNEPEEINLGAIGAVVGHELGHAIDDHGSRFDADGVFRQWMSDKDKKVFDKKTQYLIKQFDGIGHNGEFTLGENIGDLVGLTTGYKAAFSQSDDKELKKRFFLQFARVWCEVQKEDVAKRRLKTDPHSLGYARCNEQMKHQEGFAKAYNCKAGDPMALPENERVKIW